MPSSRIIVIGASAGGVQALEQVLRALPAPLDAALFIALHAPEAYPGVVRPLARVCALPVRHAVDGEPIEHGRVYVAPGDHNMILEPGTVRVQTSPKEHVSRPSINALFRSAAAVFGSRAIGVVLSGMLNDGSAGLWEIKRRGGVAIVQEPSDATFDSMPRAALTAVAVDHCAPSAAIGPLLADLVGHTAKEGERNIRVVVVEDERLVAMNLERRLRDFGYQVCASIDTGEEVLKAVAATRPDVVLMDIRLAGLVSGTDAGREVAQRFQVPVVYLTAYADEPTIAEVKRSQPYGYVMKPCSPEEVHAAIQLALARKTQESGVR